MVAQLQDQKFKIRVKGLYLMVKHYILSLNPTAKHEWDRCVLRDVLSAKRPEMAKLIAEAVNARSGNYLISVNIEVNVLEKAEAPQPEQLALNIAEVSEQPELQKAA